MSDEASPDVTLFAEALKVPATERSAFLERLCGADAALRHRVEELLKVHDAVGDFLEQPLRGSFDGDALPSPAGEKAGDGIGHYKLLQQIGEGGCGIVFMAEQEEPVRRRVALKIIKPGMDTRSVIARFEAERQALALMDHPNIAKVFDAGSTASGRPYFVMELVKGVKITDYCDRNALTSEDRLGLFVQVCRAVQHAHQKGIIHRDIKPSNILVTTTEEGAGFPMVIDFGISKATTNQRLTDKTVFTAFEMLIGTPAYMSPEQAELTSVDVDTRTDIYSLGVLLYELLTGSTPFDSGELMKAGLDEIRRVIREKEPVRPSTRLSTMTEVDLTSAAQLRRSAAPALIRSVRGDLDWIVMKALEKDRRRRYETANGLALDIQRHMANEAVSARPPSALYKFQKTVVRNKFLSGGIAVLAIVLIASLALVTASLARERKARQQAQESATKSEQVTEFLKDMLQGVGPSVAAGQDTTMLKGILDKTAERIGSNLGGQPSVEAELRSLIGRVYQEIGKYEDAERMHRAALNAYRQLFGPSSLEAAVALNGLGLALWKERNLDEAAAAHEEALAIRKRLLGGSHAEVAASLTNLSDVYRRLRRLKEADSLTREALSIRQRLFGKESLQAADSLRSLSILLGDEGNRTDSEATAREVLAMRRKLIGGDNLLVALSLLDVAWAAGYNGKAAESESLEREALAIRRRLLGEGHPDVARALYLVGDRLRNRGKLDEARSFLNAALAIQRALPNNTPQDRLDSLRSLGYLLEADGKLAESETVHREALAFSNQTKGPGSTQALAELESLIGLLIAEQKLDEAEGMLSEALTVQSIKDPSRANILALRVEILGRRGQWREAATNAAIVLENQPSEPERYHTMAALLAITRNRPEYELLCRKFITAFPEPTDPHIADIVAKDCLILPESGVDQPTIWRLAERAVTSGKSDAGLPFYQVCKALSEYRQGHFSEAVHWAEKTIGGPQRYASALGYAIVSMAKFMMQEPGAARVALAAGNDLAPVIFPVHEAEANDGVWMGWIFARASLDEASALLESNQTNRPTPKTK